MELNELLLDEIVTKEFEALLTRCEAAGVSRKDARDTLAGRFSRESLKQWSDDARVQEEKAALSPKGVLLQKAFDLWKQNKLISQFVSPDESEFNKVCLEYLKVAYGVELGDNVLVYGWAKPRGITVVDFKLSFISSENASDAFMFFTGPCWRNNPPKRMPGSHGCSINVSVEKEYHLKSR